MKVFERGNIVKIEMIDGTVITCMISASLGDAFEVTRLRKLVPNVFPDQVIRCSKATGELEWISKADIKCMDYISYDEISFVDSPEVRDIYWEGFHQYLGTKLEPEITQYDEKGKPWKPDDDGLNLELVPEDLEEEEGLGI